MQRPYYLFLSLFLLLFSQTIFSNNCANHEASIDDPDTVCGVFDIWELEWLNELVATANGENIGSIHQIGYDGVFYFQVNSVDIIADGPMYLYDCAGNLLCTFYYYTTEGCPFDIFEVNASSIEVWRYEEPCICPAVFDPVCGMDGNTYGNECEATCAGVGIFAEGECQIIQPPITVCGVSDIWELDWINELIATANGYNIGNIQQFDYNGETYFQVNSAAIVADGPMDLYDCEGNLLCTFYYYTTEDCPFDVFEANTNSIEVWKYECVCPDVYEPVCSAYGNTYDNQCEANCVGAPIIYQGVCEEPMNTNICEVGIKMFLQGALFNTNDGLMRDDLRTNNLLPLTEPYSNSPYFTHVGGGGETTTSAILNTNGTNAITDWVFLELRDAAFNLVKTRSALLQRDGDVVEVDGTSPVNFNVANGNYYVCVRHRNHLGTMTNNLMNISSTAATTVDFTNIATFGTNAQMTWNSNTNALWAGHTNNTGSISFQGLNNNINGLFFEVLTAPTNISNTANYIYDGYNEGDINMDGSTIYQGGNSDATNVFFTTIQHPQNNNYIANFTIYEQMP